MRLYPKESYDSARSNSKFLIKTPISQRYIKRMMTTELAEDEEPLSKDTIEKIEMSLKDIKEGRVYSTDEVRKRLKIA